MNIWNIICEKIQTKKFSSEQEYQHLWELIFTELLGWKRITGSIDFQRKIQIGSIERTIPDIILKHEGIDALIIEMKRFNTVISEKNIEQLFSYLKQLQLNIGILIADKIYIYYFDSIKKSLTSVNSIEFIKNNVDGLKFVDTFSYSNFTYENAISYIVDQISTSEIADYIYKNLSTDIIKESLVNYYSQKFDYDKVRKALSKVNISFEVCNEKIINYVEEEANTSLINNDLNQIGSNTQSNINKTSKISKSDAINLFIKRGYKFNHSHITFAILGKKGLFWANPDKNCVKQKWFLILYDPVSSKIYLLFIEPNRLNYTTSFEYGKLRIRKDKPIYLDINIYNESFVESGSKISFKEFIIDSISI